MKVDKENQIITFEKCTLQEAMDLVEYLPVGWTVRSEGPGVPFDVTTSAAGEVAP